MKINILKEIDNQDKDRVVELLINNSSPRQSYYFMVGLLVAMATLGLLLNSVAVVIGSMLIAPVLYPVLSLAMGIIISDLPLINRSFFTVLRSFILSLFVSFSVAIIFSSQQPNITNEIIKRTQPNLLNFMVALVAGLAVAYVITKKSVNETLPGIAISVSLVPPLAVIGIGLAKFNITMASSALVLFLVNVVGIMFSSMIIFSLLNFIAKKAKIHEEIKEEEKLLVKEKNTTN